MFESSAPYLRLLFVFAAVVCAAVAPFIVRSHAARASRTTTHVDNGVSHSVLRQVYNPYSQRLFTALPLSETGLQTGTHGETDTSRDYKKASSIIYRQSNPPRFTAGSFSNNQNSPGHRNPREETTGAQGEVRSANSIFTGQSFERWQSAVKHHPFPRGAERGGNSHYSPSVIVRKSSRDESAGPFHRISRPSQVWDLSDPQKSSNKEGLPGNVPPKVAEDQTVWQPSRSSLFSSQAGRYWSSSPPTPRWHYGAYEETNEPAAVGPPSTSRRVQSSKFFGLASQTVPPAPPISNSLDTTVNEGSPSPAPSITDFSQGIHSVSSIKTPRHRNVQSYLFRDSQTSSDGREMVSTATGDGRRAFPTTPHKQTPSDVQVFSRFPPSFKQSQTEEPTKEVQHLSNNANPLYNNAYMAQYGVQMDSFTINQHTTPETLAHMSVHPAPGSDNTVQSFRPRPHADFQGGLVNVTTGGSMTAHKPGQTAKSIFGFRGFKNAPLRAASIPSSDGPTERTHSRRHSFDKGKFKIANMHPSHSGKYSFGQRKVSTTPAKLERTPTDDSSPPPGTLDLVQTTPRPFPSRFKEAQPLMPASDVGLDGIPDRRRYRIHRRIYGLKGFGTRPLEGAKTSVSEPEKSTGGQRGFEGFRHRESQIWQHRWHNNTEPGSSHLSKTTPTEQNSEDLKSLLKKPGGAEADTRFTPDKYRNTRKIYTHLGFHPVQKRTGSATTQTQWRHREQNPATASASHRISSAYPRSAGGPKSEPRPPDKTKPFAMKPSPLDGSSSSSSTVRGKRVKAKHTSVRKLNESTSLTYGAGNAPIVRLLKRPARVKAVMYTDILGSASFSGVGVTQTQITPADKDDFPNTAARTKEKQAAGGRTLNSEAAVLSRDNTSRGPEDEVDLSSVEMNKSAVRDVGDDGDMKTSDLFLDSEGSGSGGLFMYDAFSADPTKIQGVGEDLLELDYLRTSTANITFKSMKLSPAEK
ncbi:uncharacterized protein LOC119027485 [Acanthopagrus latus]|uniref:uncharacterized protein LOC119027485 n=1 Tax=Acanthopagrus latus TaxID=8177 RepID=UPI00187C6CFE|nr:uncharacterized protein LOC119027485 [Acanthopagrus latus]